MARLRLAAQGSNAATFSAALVAGFVNDIGKQSIAIEAEDCAKLDDLDCDVALVKEIDSVIGYEAVVDCLGATLQQCLSTREVSYP